MAEDTDGMGEAVDDALRTALTVAAQVGERVARLREQTARQRDADTARQNQEYAARFDAERAATRAALAPVHDPGWWAIATTRDIAGMWETAVAWRSGDPSIAETAALIRTEVQDRYGIDVETPGTDPVHTAALLDRTDPDRNRPPDRVREAADTHAVLTVTGRRDADAPTARPLEDAGDADSTPGYDSPQRRQAFAADLDRRGIEGSTVAARILADEDNATHPRQAVASTTRRGYGLRKTGAVARAAGREHDGPPR